GCNHCCYKPINASIAEGALVALQTFHDRERIKPVLRAQLARAENVDDPENNYFALHEPCAFLDLKSGDCTVYEVRPAACRGHYTVSSPTRCDPAVVPIGTRVAFLDTSRYS